jgi:glycosyltransferase involved in cell wall biosynthesis
MGASVCMAAYNGEKYVVRQLQSILDQLSPDDEVIVVDDCSTDGTIEAVKGLNDPRVALHVNDRNRREVYSFSRAISLARHQFIFLSDQDDIWLPGRVALMTEALQTSLLATTNFDWIDQDERPLQISHDGVLPEDSGRYFKNIAHIFLGKTTYFGCAMAFRRELIPLILPIPDYVESHDWWVALAGNLAGSNIHLSDKTFWKRRHGKNATSTTSSRSLASKLRSRAIFARSLLDLQKRRRKLDISAATSAA